MVRNKTIFTREAARRNIATMYLPIRRPGSPDILVLDPIIDQYSQLLLKPGWQLLCSKGSVFAQSETETLPVNRMMEAVTGDESPLSYVQAAVCFHHLLDYSDHPTGVNAYTIMDDAFVRELDLLGQWKMGRWERSFNPIFFYDSLLHPAVILFTYHREGPGTIQKHIHRFAYQSYALQTMQRTWTSHS
ncbi:hypothetical protein QRD89_16445 [Halobacillus sp. ACCC02827]|uniref:hypothetical protein n=1 Tax=Halobacillus sp. ACCC02827 TaxID=3052090 RepID=UPI0007820087|nr:hypothetical protein [Halobacillus sp. ACCC02827]WJE15293.1 hypothetical protein QRD89_16445 [Halobacillus sp. ACCC02827]